jgi:glycosyltransferase involved in cell wall biosynthesis
MSVKTTIITLTQDRPDYLTEALASIEAQTDTDWEHLIYDNGSRDPRNLAVLKAAKARNLDKVFYTQPGGRGPDVVGFYWNVLLGMAHGRYITILDDDNRKRSNYIEKMTAVMEADASVDAVSCGWSPMNEHGAVSGEDRHWNQLTSMPKLWQSNTIDSNAIMFRRSVLDKIGQFDAQLSTNEDWHFMIRLVRACKVEHLPDVLLEYREHPKARSRRAVALGAYANWDRIRKELFTEEERFIALGGK